MVAVLPTSCFLGLWWFLSLPNLVSQPLFKADDSDYKKMNLHLPDISKSLVLLLIIKKPGCIRLQ